MCLIALALDRHPRYPLVIAANRDEYLHRPAAALDWWRATPHAAPVLAGRDLRAGGTWMGVSVNGRVAMLTNVRDLPRYKAIAPSRGAIVPAWLDTQQAASEFWRDTATRGHNPFNLLAGDLAQGQWWWADDRASAPQMLRPGLYGLSNAALDAPWPKVQRLKGALAQALYAATTGAELETLLFAALADRSVAPDNALPDTGIGLERERWLAPAFIRMPHTDYGTRCSTLLIAERLASGLSVRIVERQFDAGGHAISQRSARLVGWPLARDAVPPVHAEALSAA
jgi:uncharacterized protein with NRDE domain